MRSGTEGKIMVALLVSLLAFGFGTGTVVVMGLAPNETSTTQFNLTKTGEFPFIFFSRTNSSYGGIDSSQYQSLPTSEPVTVDNSNSNSKPSTNKNNTTNSEN